MATPVRPWQAGATDFRGRGTHDWQPNQRPENWRQKLLRLYPNGDCPLTAMLSLAKSEKTNDPHFHWFTKVLATQRAAGTCAQGTGDHTAGSTYVFTCTPAGDAKQFRVGHQVILRDADVLTTDCQGKVTDITGAAVTVTLLADAPSGQVLTYDVMWVIGNINPEGSLSPGVIKYDPTEWANYTQIFRTPISHTRTALRTNLRTGDAVVEARREALELHGIEQEKCFIFGAKSLTVGDNGKPERTTAGIKTWITSHYYNWAAESQDWLTGGETWLDAKLAALGKFGSRRRPAYCGQGFVLAINQIARSYGRFELTTMVNEFGSDIIRWVNPFCTLDLVVHPLFNQEPTMNNSAMIIEPKNLIYRYVDDTKYNPKIGPNDLDGEESEYLTEAGLELHHEETFAWLENVGLDYGA